MYKRIKSFSLIKFSMVENGYVSNNRFLSGFLGEYEDINYFRNVNE